MSNLSMCQDQLIQLAEKKGYLTFDDILDLSDSFSLSVTEVDILSESLQIRGIIFTEDDSNVQDFEDDSDRSQTDYESVFNEVLSIDEELLPLIDYVRTIKPPQRREFNNCIIQAQTGNEYARNRIFEMYMRVAIKIALQYCKRYPLSLSDTIQDALLGLHTAIDRYDYGRHGSFSTYFPFWVRNTLQRNVFWSQIPFSVPAHLSDKLFTAYDIKEDHHCELCRADRICPNLIKDLSSTLEIDAIESQRLLKCFDSTISIEELVEYEYDPKYDEQEEFILSDKGEFAERMDEEHHRERLEQTIYEIVTMQLPERQAKVIVLRYGLDDGNPRTLEEVAKYFNLTRERIRQIEAKALRKLKYSSSHLRIVGRK